MKCVNCGNELAMGATFCGECGAKVASSDDKKVKVSIIRRKSILGFAVPFTVLVDDVNVGSLKNGGTVECNVTYGKHKVIIRAVEKDTIQEIDVNDTVNSVEIHTVAKMGLIAATVKVEEVKYL